jgi:glycosyltransferase involved in cell wall biosynthesis
MPPLVSILVPAYNAAEWIRQCVESAFEQTYSPIEVILVDDGSSDGTIGIARSARGANSLRIIESPHLGGNAARNRLLEASTGDWLQFLDADDYLLPSKIATQVRVAMERDLDVVYSPVTVRRESTGIESTLAIADTSDNALHYIEWAAFCTSGLLFRRTALVDVGGWKESQPACQEHELLLRLLIAGRRFGFSSASETIYRDHGTGSVSRKSPMKTIQLRMELTDALEAHLKRTGALTDAHRRALYMARMESARTAWRFDQRFAVQLADKAKAAGHWWIRTSPGLPPHFQMAVRLGGFAAAERLAGLRRGAGS